jgi:hypothetical protein
MKITKINLDSKGNEVLAILVHQQHLLPSVQNVDVEDSCSFVLALWFLRGT